MILFFPVGEVVKGEGVRECGKSINNFADGEAETLPFSDCLKNETKAKPEFSRQFKLSKRCYVKYLGNSEVK